MLRFGETAAFSLTVAQDVTIGSNDTFSTGSGNANAHVLSVGGNLINNGTLDFSTNNNLAGAGIVFTGASSTTFGGTGAVTDIQPITINKGNSSANILELTVSTSRSGQHRRTVRLGLLFIIRAPSRYPVHFSGVTEPLPARSTR